MAEVDSAGVVPPLPDLCDEFGDALGIAEPGFVHFGGVDCFSGPIRTLKVFEDNSLVGDALRGPGDGHVLVVDGGASLRCALVGDNLAQAGVDNGWAGVVVWGCVRDVEVLAEIPFGVAALAAHPLRSVKRGIGEAELPLSFAGVRWLPGGWVYADRNGVAFSPKRLT